MWLVVVPGLVVANKVVDISPAVKEVARAKNRALREVTGTDQQDRLSHASGSMWLQAIVATCAGFCIALPMGIILLYKQSDECPENTCIFALISW